MNQNSIDLIKIAFSLDTWKLSIEISMIVLGIMLLALGIFTWINRSGIKRFKLVKLDIPLGGIGKAELKPNLEDIQIAHKIWTELVTRKAAIPIDPEHDVIVEIYDSWYALFGQIRELISNIPAELIKTESSTKELVRISTSTLNDGLRPHLTRWQARFRSWYEANSEMLKTITPQELQATYPEYQLLVEDMRKINQQMIAYAFELKKIIDD